MKKSRMKKACKHDVTRVLKRDRWGTREYVMTCGRCKKQIPKY